ncbi:hypothetical protein VTK56DRAFT_3074 [Thermocarpiscus australiensis]
MAPVITHPSDLTELWESFDHGEFLATEFAVIEDDDTVYYGRLNMPKLKITSEQFTSALRQIPDEHLFPELPGDANITVAPDDLDKSKYYIKRPRLVYYPDYKSHLFPSMLLEEAQALELVSQHPHPGIIGYHGCRVHRGRITGLVLDRHEHDLYNYLRDGVGTIDKEAFMAALESAVRHLHSNSLAHNDLNPHNILVNDSGMPVIADFGSCRKVGEKLATTRGTPAWIEGSPEDYTTSEEGHDLFAIEKIQAWLDNPTFRTMPN